MNIQLKPGKYIVAVSGGVDSVVLLHLLNANYQLLTTNYQFVVAHFDHGIRPDAHKDAEFVEKLASDYGLKFYGDSGKLGANASEEKARKARYKFLFDILRKESADAVITAHHGDDLVETAIINLRRGTGRMGLSALRSRKKVVRPLLGITKKDILEYADANNLEWQEDETNRSDRYLRNRVRKSLAVSRNSQDLAELNKLLSASSVRNDLIDKEIEELLNGQEALVLNRTWFISLPYNVCCEIVASWLRKSKISFDRKTIERTVVVMKTQSPRSRFDLDKSYYLQIEKKTISLTRR